MTISKQKTIKTIAVLSLLALMFVTAGSALAKEAPKTKLATSTKAQMERPGERLATSTKEKLEQRKSEAELKVSKKIEERAQFQSEQLSRMIKSLESIFSRVESRISKMQTEGKFDVSKASVLLATAKETLTKAKADVVAYQTKVSSVTGTATKEIQKSLQALHKTTVESIKTANKALVNVINSIKPGANKIATSTAEKN